MGWRGAVGAAAVVVALPALAVTAGAGPSTRESGAVAAPRGTAPSTIPLTAAPTADTTSTSAAATPASTAVAARRTPATTAGTATTATTATTASTTSTTIGPLAPNPAASTAATGTTADADTGTTTSTTLPPNRGVLLFEDDFDTALDSNKWMTCYPWWGIAPLGCTNHGNPEQQWYLPEQVSTGAGALRLTARRTPTQGVDKYGNPVTFPYRSGIVTSARRFSFTYGYVEFRARIPKGASMWPALWLLPTDYSWPPEIDVMEGAGGDTTKVSVTFHGTDGRAPQRIVSPAGVDFATGWHTFAVDWSPAALTWYVDGTAYLTVTEAVPSTPMYLLANLAVGGPAGAVTDASPDEATFEVDYVRVWLR